MAAFALADKVDTSEAQSLEIVGIPVSLSLRGELTPQWSI